MNEEIHCITNEGKTTKNEWENDDSDFLREKFLHFFLTLVFSYLLV